MSAKTVLVEIWRSVDGGAEYPAGEIRLPEEACADALAYVERHARLPAQAVLEIFLVHWNRGINLMKTPWPRKEQA